MIDRLQPWLTCSLTRLVAQPLVFTDNDICIASTNHEEIICEKNRSILLMMCMMARDLYNSNKKRCGRKHEAPVL